MCASAVALAHPSNELRRDRVYIPYALALMPVASRPRAGDKAAMFVDGPDDARIKSVGSQLHHCAKCNQTALQALPVLTSSASTAVVMCFLVIEEDSPAARKAACRAALRICPPVISNPLARLSVSTSVSIGALTGK